MSLLCVVAFVVPAVAGAVPRRSLRATKLTSSGPDAFTYSQFMEHYGRPYTPGTMEYLQRASLFQESADRIRLKNAKNVRENRPWKAGFHEFMDWTVQERRSLQGYKPSGKHHASRKVLAGLQLDHRAAANTSNIEVDNFMGGDGAHYRNQGNCGSCWAISAVEALEAQLKRSGRDVRVSAQALVDCVPNPQHCGGSGGCDGATGELAYGFVMQHGIPLETALPYTAATGSCQMGAAASRYPSSQRVTVSGWTTLPSNKAEPLRQALVQQGSVVVAVDGNDWFDYSSGIFDGCSKDAELGHAVLAKGYGTEDGKKYWTIQNSWGRGWGENGDIRLLMHDDDDSWCGTDHDPSKGVGCDGGPPTVEVCGMCGLLYDSIFPTGVQIENDADVGSVARTEKGDYTPWKPPSDEKTWTL